MTKINTLSKLVLICGLATATLSAGSVMAKGHSHKGEHAQVRFLLSDRAADKLSLTNEQQTQLKEIYTAQKTQIKVLRSQNKDARKAQRQAYKAQMDTLLSAPNFDENAAKELLTARQDKKQQLGLIKLKTQHQVMQLLNAEQKEKLAKIQQRRR